MRFILKKDKNILFRIVGVMATDKLVKTGDARSQGNNNAQRHS